MASATSTLGTSGAGSTSSTSTPSAPACSPRSPRLLTRARVVQTIHGLDGERAKWGGWPACCCASARGSAPGCPTPPSWCRRRCRTPTASATAARPSTSPTARPRRSPARPSGITERWGLTKGSYVLVVGRLVPEKAPEHLLARVRRRARRHPPGAGRRLQPHRRVRGRPRGAGRGGPPGDHGRLRLRHELEELYSNAAVFVLPSLLEGLPLTLLEAASYGCPIVASDIPPHLEVIGASGPGARLFPAGDIHQLTKAITRGAAGAAGGGAGGCRRALRAGADHLLLGHRGGRDGCPLPPGEGPSVHRLPGASVDPSMTSGPSGPGGRCGRLPTTGAAGHRLRPQRDHPRQHDPGLDAGSLRGRRGPVPVGARAAGRPGLRLRRARALLSRLGTGGREGLRQPDVDRSRGARGRGRPRHAHAPAAVDAGLPVDG